MKRKSKGNGIIVWLVTIILIMTIFIGLILSGIVDVNIHISKKEVKTDDKVNNIIDDDSGKNKDSSDVKNGEGNEVADNTNIEYKQKSSVSREQILSYYKDNLSMYGNTEKYLYSIKDLNNDNIPELFIFKTGFIGNEIIAYTSVFTYDESVGNKSNNYIVGVGMISGRLDSNTVLYKMKDGRLLSVYGHMGYECTEYYTLTKDWLIRNSLSCRETNDYVSGDELLEFKKIDDTSLIDNYK